MHECVDVLDRLVDLPRLGVDERSTTGTLLRGFEGGGDLAQGAADRGLQVGGGFLDLFQFCDERILELVLAHRRLPHHVENGGDFAGDPPVDAQCALVLENSQEVVPEALRGVGGDTRLGPDRFEVQVRVGTGLDRLERRDGVSPERVDFSRHTGAVDLVYQSHEGSGSLLSVGDDRGHRLQGEPAAAQFDDLVTVIDDVGHQLSEELQGLGASLEGFVEEPQRGIGVAGLAAADSDQLETESLRIVAGGGCGRSETRGCRRGAGTQSLGRCTSVEQREDREIELRDLFQEIEGVVARNVVDAGAGEFDRLVPQGEGGGFCLRASLVTGGLFDVISQDAHDVGYPFLFVVTDYDCAELRIRSSTTLLQ